MTRFVHPPVPPRLEAGEVHLWRVDLSRDRDGVSNLSSDERARLARYSSTRAGQRYQRARNGLRTLLGAYLQQPPRELVFRYGAHGKPSLGKDSALQFNLSHSGDVAVLAVAGASLGEVGVDIERLRDDVDVARVATRAFAPAEDAWLRALPLSHDERVSAFFVCWTRHEACLKARGTGWSGVKSAAGMLNLMTSSNEDRLTVQGFDFHGFIGALAVTHAPRELRFFDA
jgi:4'-phosphopantetheinyl transferase